MNFDSSCGNESKNVNREIDFIGNKQFYHVRERDSSGGEIFSQIS